MTIYYVTNNKAGSGDGSNDNPWCGFDDIAWEVIGAGDILDGLGKHYDTSLLVGASGSKEAFIYIQNMFIESIGDAQQIDIRDSYKYIYVRDMTLIVADGKYYRGVYIDNTTNVIIDNLTIIGQGNLSENGFSSGVKVRDSHYVDVINCDISRTNNGIQYIFNLGVMNGGFVAFNYIHDLDAPIAEHGDGIQVSADEGYHANCHDMLILKNKITNWGDDGIDFFRAGNITVKENIIYDYGAIPDGNGNGIKAGGPNEVSYSNKIIGNWVYGLNGTGANFGITSNSGANNQYYNNIIYDVERAIMTTVDAEICNNIAFGREYGISFWSDVGGITVHIKNNIAGGENQSINGVAPSDAEMSTIHGGYNLIINHECVNTNDQVEYIGNKNDLGKNDSLLETICRALLIVCMVNGV